MIGAMLEIQAYVLCLYLLWGGLMVLFKALRRIFGH